jgi:alpha-1,2-mannosyltransferase
MFHLIGSTRGPDDEQIVADLKELAKTLKIAHRVQFHLNLPRSEINSLFSLAKVGIHTMKQEHFGISIVEMMAAGLVTIAHASAGPLLDIIGGSKSAVVGYLAKTEADYAKYVVEAMRDYYDIKHTVMVKSAKRWVTDAFGVSTFEK